MNSESESVLSKVSALLPSKDDDMAIGLLKGSQAVEHKSHDNDHYKHALPSTWLV